MDENIKKHLQVALEGYKQNLTGVNEFIENAKQNLTQAETAKEDMENRISELNEVLGITEDEETEDVSPEAVSKEPVASN
jgi:BioD-like phosphotransacetylase family protein